MEKYTEYQIDEINKSSLPLSTETDLDMLLSEIGNARYVLLGEASHGAHEYYTWQSKLSRLLLAEKGFTAVGIEGDWPDCYELNRYAKNYRNSGDSAKEVLGSFNRWPSRMWANWETVAFAKWLRKYNSHCSRDQCTGFYGLDVYSLWQSITAIFEYIKIHSPRSLPAVQQAMDCFEPYNVKKGFSYADRHYGMTAGCRKEVEKLLKDLQRKSSRHDGDDEAAFNAEQNALVARNAEQYYRAMLDGGESTWNIRDIHMTDTAERLLNFYGSGAKIIIWARNTHIGDARATNMKYSGLVNIVQLIKEKHADEKVYRVGFGSYTGSVIAGAHWGGNAGNASAPVLPLWILNKENLIWLY